MNGDLRAIYFANEGGKSGGGGKKLEDLKGDDNKALVQMKNGGGKEVQSAFGYCVGEGSENRCKNAQGGSVVLVGDQRLSETELKSGWEGWFVRKDQTPEVRNDLDLISIDKFLVSELGVQDDMSSAQLNVDNLSQVFKNSESVEKGSLSSLQSWFCPGAGGGAVLIIHAKTDLLKVTHQKRIYQVRHLTTLFEVISLEASFMTQFLKVKEGKSSAYYCCLNCEVKEFLKAEQFLW